MTTKTKPDYEWWEHPERPCKDNLEYSDTALIKETGRARTRVLNEMKESCMHCPVLQQCRVDLLVDVAYRPQSQVRAGIVFR